MHLEIFSLQQLTTLDHPQSLQSCEFVPQALSPDDLVSAFHFLKECSQLTSLVLSRQNWTMRSIIAFDQWAQTQPPVTTLQLSRNFFDQEIFIPILAHAICQLPSLHLLGLNAVRWTADHLNLFLESCQQSCQSVHALSLSLLQPSQGSHILLNKIKEIFPQVSVLIIGQDFVESSLLPSFLHQAIHTFPLKTLQNSGSLCDHEWATLPSNTTLLDSLMMKMLRGHPDHCIAALHFFLQHPPSFLMFSHHPFLNSTCFDVLSNFHQPIAIDLSYCQINTESLSVLLKKFSSIFALFLDSHHIESVEEWIQILSLLSQQPRLSQLRISGAPIEDSSFEVIVQWIEKSCLTSFAARDAKLSLQSAQSLLNIIAKTTLTSCDLTYNQLPSTLIMAVMQECQSHQIELKDAVAQFLTQPQDLTTRQHLFLKNHLLSTDQALFEIYSMGVRKKYAQYSIFPEDEYLVDVIEKQQKISKVPYFCYFSFLFDSSQVSFA